MNPLWTDITQGTLGDHQVRLLDLYLDALIETNKQINLTRITDRAEAEVKHVADALTLLPLLPEPIPRRIPLTLADVGTGGGVPGVILAIARPDIRVTLIDSTRKKLDAVAAICESLGIKNVEILHARMESVKLTFDVVTARGVANLDTLVGWCRGLMKPDGLLLAMKGPKAGEEIEAAKRSLGLARLKARQSPVYYAGLEGHINIRISKG